MNSADDIPKESSMKAKSKTSTDNLAVEKIRSNGDDYGTSPEKTVESEPTTTEIVDLTQEGDFQSIEKSEPGGLLGKIQSTVSPHKYVNQRDPHVRIIEVSILKSRTYCMNFSTLGTKRTVRNKRCPHYEIICKQRYRYTTLRNLATFD